MKKHKTVPTTDLTKDVMAEINSGRVKMKPKIYFITGSILTGLGIASSLFTTLLVVTLTIFRIRKFGLMGFIWPGKTLLAPFPILLLIVSLLVFWGGVRLLKRYDFSYKHNFMAISIMIITATIALGFLFDQLGVNQRLQQRPHLKPYYQQRQPELRIGPGMHQPRRQPRF